VTDAARFAVILLRVKEKQRMFQTECMLEHFELFITALRAKKKSVVTVGAGVGVFRARARQCFCELLKLHVNAWH
jgi:hypothetical protein